VYIWLALQRGAMCLNHVQGLSCLISTGTRHHRRCVIHAYVRSRVFVTVSWSYNVSGIFLNPTIRASVFSRYHQLHAKRYIESFVSAVQTYRCVKCFCRRNRVSSCDLQKYICKSDVFRVKYYFTLKVREELPITFASSSGYIIITSTE